MEHYFGDLWLVRMLIEKGVALIYFMAFLSAYHQFPSLLGEHGLLPVTNFIKNIPFRKSPSLFYWRYSDRFFLGVCVCGMAISVVIFFGLGNYLPLSLAMIFWLILWGLYLSIVNIGQTFYAFGWESMLLEAGFIAAFLGNAKVVPSFIPILIFRWMLFRTEVGAGLIKLRHDSCWRDLTCLFYHYETQPLPNGLSRYFHQLPKWFHRISVVFSHFVQLIVPFALFAPQPCASIASSLIIVHQLLLIISGNFSWLNWLTIVLAFSGLSDEYLPSFFLVFEPIAASPIWYDIVIYGFASLVIFLSIKPLRNLFSKHQLMNFSYNPFHLINTYGAFGSISKQRYEVIIEATKDDLLSTDTKWQEYEFKAKPGAENNPPPFVAPYHLRLDWLMWFLPLYVQVTKHGLVHKGYEIWFVRLIEKLLNNDKQILSLLKKPAFVDESAPTYIRARFFQYRFTSRNEYLATKSVWKREYIDDYLPPVSLKQFHHERS